MNTLERTPPSSYGSDSDLSRHQFNLMKHRKRREEEMDSCHCESSMTKFHNDIMENITRTIKSTVESVITEKMDKFSTDLDNINIEMKKITKDNAAITASVTEIKGRLNEIEASTNFATNRQDQFDSRLCLTEQRTKNFEQYESDIAELRNKYTTVSAELKARQQWDRLLNLEVIGVPETNNEDLVKVLAIIAKFLDVNLTATDIEFANRIQPKQPKPGAPRTIIVKLRNRVVKDNLLAGIRRFHGITRSDIGMQGTQRIFVNEHLTLENKNLYKKCRELATSNSYKFIWIRNCKIFVRKDDKSPKIAINKEEDLIKIK
ncbi:Zinc finger DNA binding protein [Operophtera brumata]|uniref:Zinc finger DNA binding protein n=1 Tax=Operophtera brumata TaxID=104452 RepID=A0A0L7L7A2_OPEBR|nr:Zinc finger DNA binding protein [Operophtera brumata]KOB71161.1 Zinc finger DNA binding protein [Operophtera brumata]